jgi:hypothetical protein
MLERLVNLVRHLATSAGDAWVERRQTSARFTGPGIDPTKCRYAIDLNPRLGMAVDFTSSDVALFYSLKQDRLI